MTFIEREVTVGELREMYRSNKYNIEINTPDGYQKLGNWYDKGVLKMVKIITQSFETVCAVNHLIQLEDNTWAQASELEEGIVVQTLNGLETVIGIEEQDAAECYDFEVLHPNHRYYGDGIVSHNSGKSYICSGNIIRHAQEQGIYVILIDSENALDESWLQALNVDTSEDKLLKLNMAMIDDVAKTIHEFMKSYKDMPEEERPKVLFVVDSIGMLMTPTEVNQFEAGDMKGDMGRKAKALKSLVTNCVNMFGSYNVGMVATNHTYASQDMFDPDDKISGGQGFIYASSIVVAMKKLKLKEDEDGNKVTEVNGIRASCKIMKTRYAKPFESIQVKIPYTTGMNPYSGLLELFEKMGVISQQGNRLKYIDSNGKEWLEYRKAWSGDLLDMVMIDYVNKQVETPVDMHTEDEISEDAINE
jgi:RecA/RadA recombinase